MERLWSPWRYRYVSKQTGGEGCVFCLKMASGSDEENLVLYRGERNFVVLNLYPYTTGHLMVVPYAHAATMAEAGAETLAEMTRLVEASVGHLGRVYGAPGFNVGMNIGECAGAGIAGHIHMHVLPRWPGDANFMTTTAETRVMPEELADTYRKLRAAFAG